MKGEGCSLDLYAVTSSGWVTEGEWVVVAMPIQVSRNEFWASPHTLLYTICFWPGIESPMGNPVHGSRVQQICLHNVGLQPPKPGARKVCFEP